MRFNSLCSADCAGRRSGNPERQPRSRFPFRMNSCIMPIMNQITIDEMVKAYPQSVRLTEVKIRDRGEVKKLDAGDLFLRTGDRVLLDADGEVTYGVVYTAP